MKTPIRRTDTGWDDISWDEAYTEITEKFKAIQQAHGKNALAIYLGNPNAHSLGNGLFLKPFMKSIGTINRYSSASADQMPHYVAANFMLGAGMLIPVPDIDRTDFMLIIGGNPVVSNGSMMTAPNVIGRMKAIQKRGGKIVVVDPRCTKTAKVADQHLFIRPEKDALLLFAVIHCVFASNKVNLLIIWALLGIGILLASRMVYTTLVTYTGAVPSEFYSVQKRPEYKTYQQTTNIFFPGPSKS